MLKSLEWDRQPAELEPRPPAPGEVGHEGPVLGSLIGAVAVVGAVVGLFLWAL